MRRQPEKGETLSSTKCLISILSSMQDLNYSETYCSHLQFDLSYIQQKSAIFFFNK